MSMKLDALNKAKTGKRNRDQILALMPAPKYEDGLTKQCHKDECDISKIMDRFEKTATISHVAKYEGVYADFSDFDFHEQTNRLTKGIEIFDALPAELRQEFGQSPAKFFRYVNDPQNSSELKYKLAGMAAPGRQLPSADQEAAKAAASEPLASEKTKEAPAKPEPK